MEDELFSEYPLLAPKFGVPVPKTPQPASSWVDTTHMKYIMKTCTFFSRFDELLQGPSFDKYELEAAIVYCNDDKYIDLIHDIHIALLYVFIDEFEEGNRFEYAKEYGLVYYLIKHLKDDFLELHFRIFWPELLYSLATFPDFSEMLNPEIISIFGEIV